MKIALLFEQGWQKKSAILYLFLPIAMIYWLIVTVRSLFYKLKWLSRYRAKIPVIIVGNITLGGSGKTPLVIYLAEILKKLGYQPAVISRGYRGTAPAYPCVVSFNSSPGEVGDEPLLIYQRSNIPVIVDPRRVRAVQYIEKNLPEIDIIVSDDGLQHYQLERDLEIAVMNDKLQFGNRWLFPVGPLRESQKRLKTVDFVISNHKMEHPNQFMLAIKAERLIEYQTGKFLDLNYFKNQRVHAVCGIAYPQRFFDTLHSLKIDFIPHTFTDHHFFRYKDLFFQEKLPIIMTEKDAVKCQAFVDLPLYCLQISVQPSFEFENVLSQKLSQLIVK